ncbi:WXG100 family type VII secretion target [Umezawaea sp. Da 62-37]|uniref:WXG100 family type VII secretion target n=1 Tax=Umezawaea sp. Da 62-37 TaxID=3075927 RepID=UPI0028F71680|nr:WXG100 family type VII secretion target [Umezawaea sp. Da 62-37]WNV90765.1 WXG100 family type VII secretion target [Umezawaea sp. Da 62-37]
MTGGGFEVDVQGLRQGGTQFSSAADALGSVFQALDSALSGEGQCWGGDESGQTFAKEYVPNAKATADAFKNLTTALGDIRTGIDQSADAYEGSDQGNSAGISKTY